MQVGGQFTAIRPYASYSCSSALSTTSVNLPLNPKPTVVLVETVKSEAEAQWAETSAMQVKGEPRRTTQPLGHSGVKSRAYWSSTELRFD